MYTVFDDYIRRNSNLLLQTLRELCGIPAPSHYEQQRAAYCKGWLEDHGIHGAYVDEAYNVVYPLNCDGSNAITVFTAHTDTVFPDTEPLPYVEDEENIYCPGVGDDTASVAVLLLAIKYCVEENIQAPNGFLFVLNSGEEGLGNLKGTRQIFEEYAHRITAFISFDALLGCIYDNCAGSHRYEVTVTTAGGHSFQKFGNANAIIELSKIIGAIDRVQIPLKAGERTTYNIGTIHGGTSVNTIAQNASMLCEYRSTDWECLSYMEQKFAQIFDAAFSDDVAIHVEKVGDRPCNRTDREAIEAFKARFVPAVKEVVGDITFKSASTDCNIPLSLGIPALCVGVYRGGGSHTREEWVSKASLPTGLRVALTTILSLC